MKSLLLFDAEVQPYRQPIYEWLAGEFARHGYRLHIVYDTRRNHLAGGLYTGVRFSFRSFRRIAAEHDCRVMILFVWLRYKFLLPFMMYARWKGIRMVSWCHGINLQKKDQFWVNKLYYIRQKLAHAVLLYSESERKHVRTKAAKVFVANNTLNFEAIPSILSSREELKEKYGLAGKKVVLCVGRMDVNNRKPQYLVDGFERFPFPGGFLLLVGPGLDPVLVRRMENRENMRAVGPIYDPIPVNELFRLADVFCMPGAIGLAINQAFYHGLPVVLENVNHGPEGIYFQEGRNGLLFREGDVEDMMAKLKQLCSDEALQQSFSAQAKKTVGRQARMDLMLAGFLQAVRYAEH